MSVPQVWRISFIILIASFLAQEANAELLRAIRPGLMCISSDALARLTLPDGSSRSRLPGASREDLQAEQAGGCKALTIGGVLRTKEVRRNTSIVYVYDEFGSGEEQIYYVPNVDFEKFIPPGGYWHDEMRRCPQNWEVLYAKPLDSSILDLSGEFFDSLPPDLRKRMERSATPSKCEMGWRCVWMETNESIAKWHLEKQWDDFQCAHRR